MTDNQRVVKIKERERTIENLLVRRCNEKGWLCWKLTSPQVKGVPDRMIITDHGHVAFVEVKRPGGKLSALQTRVIRNLMDRGVEARVVATKDDVEVTIQHIAISDSIKDMENR